MSHYTHTQYNLEVEFLLHINSEIYYFFYKAVKKMYSTNNLKEYQLKNDKLDEQLYKLRQAKTEMSSLVNDLDNLLEQTSHFAPLNNQKSYLIEDISVLLNDYDDYSLSDSNSSSIILAHEIQPTVVYSTSKPPLVPKKSSAKIKFSYTLPINNHQDYYDSTDEYNLINNMTQFSQQCFPTTTITDYSSSDEKKFTRKERRPRRYSTSVNLGPKKRPPSVNEFNKRPTSSLSLTYNNFNKKSFSRSSSSASLSTTNPKLKDIGPGWRASYKSTTKSTDYEIYKDPNAPKCDPNLVTVKRKIKFDPKDIGNGWKHVVSKSNDFEAYKDPNSDRIKPDKNLVTVRPRFKIDKKDVGSGWKPTLKKSSGDYDVYRDPNPTEYDPNLVTVRPRLKTDSKDIGGGWKPAVKSFKSKEDLNKEALNQKIPHDPYIDPAKLELKEMKKAAKDDNDIGPGWRPAGQVKQEELFKFKPFDKATHKPIQIAKTYNPNKNEENEIEDRPPVPVKSVPKRPPPAKTYTPDKKWNPALRSNSSTTKTPNTWLDDAMLKTAHELKKAPKPTPTKKDKALKSDNVRQESDTNLGVSQNSRNKSSSQLHKNNNLITSTPNQSVREEEELISNISIKKYEVVVESEQDKTRNESIIESATPNSENTKPAQPETDSNEKMSQDLEREEDIIQEIKDSRSNNNSNNISQSKRSVKEESEIKEEENKAKEDDLEKTIEQNKDEAEFKEPETTTNDFFSKLFNKVSSGQNKEDDEIEEIKNDEVPVEKVHEEDKNEALDKQEEEETKANNFFSNFFSKIKSQNVVDESSKSVNEEAGGTTARTESEGAVQVEDDDDENDKPKLWQPKEDEDD